jgi:hypothetical protein
MMNENHATNPDEDKAQNPLETFVNHQRRALEETGKALETFLPPGFKEHSSEAGREFVKGWKVLVDATISELERLSKEFDKSRQTGSTGGDDRPSSTGATKVKVQVD